MEDVDVEFDPQAYSVPVKRWMGDSYQKARTVCAYEKEEDSPTPQFRTKVQHDAFYGHLVKKSVFAHKSMRVVPPPPLYPSSPCPSSPTRTTCTLEGGGPHPFGDRA
jgi:hypothetical protein